MKNGNFLWEILCSSRNFLWSSIYTDPDDDESSDGDAFSYLNGVIKRGGRLIGVLLMMMFDSWFVCWRLF